MKGPITRRLIGALSVGMADAGFGSVQDPRRQQGRRWPLRTFFVSLVTGLCCGATSLRQVEYLTTHLAVGARRVLNIFRRVPDTTLRDLLVHLEPEQLHQRLQMQVRRGIRRKSFHPIGTLPFGVLALDGKSVTVKNWDGVYAQRVQRTDKATPYGLLRTFTATLVSCVWAPCLGAYSIPGDTNEMATFQGVLAHLVQQFAKPLDLFRLVICDAGSCSRENAAFSRSLGVHYAMRLTDGQPYLHQRALSYRWDLSPMETYEEKKGRNTLYYRAWYTDSFTNAHQWTHLRGVVRVQRVILNEYGTEVESGERFWLTSLPATSLSLRQWLTVVRSYWRVESTHNILDTTFKEDEHPIITADAKAAYCVLLLRRIAYNLVASYRNITQRSETKRKTAYKELLRDFEISVLQATDWMVDGLRCRSESPATQA